MSNYPLCLALRWIFKHREKLFPILSEEELAKAFACPYQTSTPDEVPSTELPEFLLPDFLQSTHELDFDLELLEMDLQKYLHECSSFCDILEQKYRIWTFLNRVNSLFRTTLHIEDLARIATAASIAPFGIGFSRALLLLPSENGTAFWIQDGYIPEDESSFHTHWKQMQTQSLEETIATLPSLPQPWFQKAIIHFDEEPFFQSLFEEGKCQKFNESDIPEKFRFAFNGPETCFLPLIANNAPVGLMIADNIFAVKPINDLQMNVWQNLGNQLALVLENALLHKQLKNRLTDLETAYENLRENQIYLLKFEKMASLGEISSMLVHELQNPLLVIGDFARKMVRSALPRFKITRCAQSILHEMDHLEKMLTTVLDYAETNDSIYEPLSIHHLLDKSLTLLQPSLENNRIQIYKRYASNLPIVHGIADQIYQVFINLLQNAIQATQLVDRRNIWITTGYQHGFVEIFVVDSGPGIPENQQAQIFDMFFSTRSAGSGLGLTIVKEIVKRHRGHVNLQISNGQKTSFQILLPYKQDRETS